MQTISRNMLYKVFNDWSEIIGLFLVTFLYLIYWFKRPHKFPPGPRGIPLFGYLPFIGSRPYETAAKLSKKYGPIFSIRFGAEDHLFLNDYESIHKALVKNGATLSGRRRYPPLEHIEKDNGMVLLDYGDKWKTQRKFGLLTLRGFGVGKKGMENICLEELQYLSEEIRKNHAAFDISDLLHNAVSNNICQITLGKRFGYDDKEFKIMLQSVIQSFSDPKITITTTAINLAPFLRYVPPFSFFNAIFLKKAHLISDWLKNIKEEHERTFDQENIRDFIDAFILEQKERNDSTFTELQLLVFIRDLFVAGTETTSTTLYWSLLCFLHYPETQEKIREEVFQVIGSSGAISMSKKPEMPYTSAFIQEVMRFRTLVPMNLPHIANKDTEIDGYLIPKNTMIHTNLWAVHNDPNLWKDPSTFNPERFLDDKGKFISSKYVIPFSLGPRRCLGEQLANMEVFIFLVGMVQKFQFLPDPKAKKLPSLDNGISGLTFVPASFNLLAKEV